MSVWMLQPYSINVLCVTESNYQCASSGSVYNAIMYHTVGVTEIMLHYNFTLYILIIE